MPATVALSFDTVQRIASGELPDVAGLLDTFDTPLVSVRPSSQDPDWGGPGAILNIGMNDARHAELAQTHGEEAANALYLRFVQSYAIHVARLDPDMFEWARGSTMLALQSALAAYEDETDEAFPAGPRRTAPRSAALHGAGLGRHVGAAAAEAQGRAGGCRRLALSCRRWRWGSGRAIAARA